MHTITQALPDTSRCTINPTIICKDLTTELVLNKSSSALTKLNIQLEETDHERLSRKPRKV